MGRDGILMEDDGCDEIGRDDANSLMDIGLGRVTAVMLWI